MWIVITLLTVTTIVSVAVIMSVIEDQSKSLYNLRHRVSELEEFKNNYSKPYRTRRVKAM